MESVPHSHNHQAISESLCMPNWAFGIYRHTSHAAMKLSPAKSCLDINRGLVWTMITVQEGLSATPAGHMAPSVLNSNQPSDSLALIFSSASRFLVAWRIKPKVVKWGLEGMCLEMRIGQFNKTVSLLVRNFQTDWYTLAVRACRFWADWCTLSAVCHIVLRESESLLVSIFVLVSLRITAPSGFFNDGTLEARSGISLESCKPSLTLFLSPS